MKHTIEDIEIIKQLAQTQLTIKQQFLKFKEITKKSRATFFRVRKSLCLRIFTKPYNYICNDIKKCYFCLNQVRIIHHIDKDKTNNNKDNLLPLCYSCHNKIHRVLIKFNQV